MASREREFETLGKRYVRRARRDGYDRVPKNVLPGFPAPITVTFQVRKLIFHATKNRWIQSLPLPRPAFRQMSGKHRPQVQKDSKSFVLPLLHRGALLLVVGNP